MLYPFLYRQYAEPPLPPPAVAAERQLHRMVDSLVGIYLFYVIYKADYAAYIKIISKLDMQKFETELNTKRKHSYDTLNKAEIT